MGLTIPASGWFINVSTMGSSNPGYNSIVIDQCQCPRSLPHNFQLLPPAKPRLSELTSMFTLIVMLLKKRAYILSLAPLLSTTHTSTCG
ncbi:MAG: hypothetical protein R2795_04015 [Saprospiraceae bacterium]